ncbi:SDR family oxidoreductase [Pectobacterium polaris]|uniref:UDP-2-acetamido-2,6-beta-L-arabino-hexul-4-ose reductase n=1 Tax=Pectobacterium polaris TaxID=2042057 RepID=UPI000D61B4C4|nr:NAD-dependent epimerase/dehydratase family protein [Pectobacterium polaris]MCU1788935.1 SDR family oxidoreductase [Pectobacterium polaris]PWD59408.1 capsular biosynthesis protein [Pectobacterium polaris]GKV82500.1 UDP-2-acetamido-2,6-dideoxy-beta-L-talose 4-dehydrogenase [Pectobacterium carotovorum subsp. carotovorum]
MKILITGAEGFIGRNLCLRLEEAGFTDLIKIDRRTLETELTSALLEAEFVFHLAGVNRPKDESEFHIGNSDLTKKIIGILESKKEKTAIVLSSSTQSINNSPYGLSKAEAERWVEEYGKRSGAEYYIYRLPNVFGKWCKPNYNSFVATFCHNIANDMEITVHEPKSPVTLVYIDDLCSDFIALLNKNNQSGYRKITPEYSSSVGEVANFLHRFKESRNTMITEDVGTGFIRALYSTYLSYLPPAQFSYTVPSFSDSRGVFCEMLKTVSSGQFSFFTAHPGITRGGHYHHTKNEKFLVIKGTARFKFEHVITGEKHELTVTSNSYQVIETVPGWTHDVTNVGQDELVVMLWANEIFDREKPDTISRVLQ